MSLFVELLSLCLSLPLMARGGKRETDVGLPKVVMLMKVVLCYYDLKKQKARPKVFDDDDVCYSCTIFAGD